MRKNIIQRANLGQIEIDTDGKSANIGGLGAVFYRADDPGTEFKLFDGVVERLMPTAFDGVEAQDVRSTFNHDMNQILGRTSAGTLRLNVTEAGLDYQVEINQDDPMAVGVQARVDRGDVDGSSIWFYIEDETRREEGEKVVYEINKVRLVEVGPVALPAYTATTAEARAAHIESRRADLNKRQLEIDLMEMDFDLLKRRTI